MLCPGRSFSSVVCAVIGQHPAAFGLPEVNLFKWETIGDLLDHASPTIGMPFLAAGLRRTLAELHHGKQTEETIVEVDAWLASRRDWSGSRVYSEICERAAPKLIVEKSPTNVHRGALERLIAAFPRARFLHLSRHPRSTCRSREKALRDRPIARLGAAYREANFDHERVWFELHARIIEFSTTLTADQYLYLQGEWFLEYPDTALRQICEWLGLPMSDEILALMKKPEDSPFSSFGPKSALTGNNPGFLENPKLRTGKLKEERLDGSLEWIRDRKTNFSEPTVMLANMLGYT